MKINVVTKTDKTTVNVNPEIFDVGYNEKLLHEVITSYRSKGRTLCSSQLSRSDVRGGGAKPWRQKGLGKARAGTIRSPLWRGGGVTFASSKANYDRKINRKVYKKAIKIVLSELQRTNRLIVIDSISVKPKTKEFLGFLKELKLDSVIIVTDQVNTDLYLASRNVPNVSVVTSKQLDILSLLKYKKVCITLDALKSLEDILK